MLDSTLAGKTLNSFPISELMVVAVCAFLVYYVILCLHSPLAHLPGTWDSPFASIRMRWLTLTGSFTSMRGIHRQIGPVVRFAPNMVSIADPDALKIIYGSHRHSKSIIYDAWGMAGETIFSTRRHDFHKNRKRLVAPAYSQSVVNHLEPSIYKTGIEKLVARLHKNASSGEPIDLMNVLQHMTADVIGEISFGGSFNTIDDDSHPLNTWIEKDMMLGILSIVVPQLNLLCSLGLFKEYIDAHNSLLNYARQAVKHRQKSSKKHNDILQSLLESSDEKSGERLSDDEVVAETMLQLVAGTDTTAITLSWAFHLLMENPHCAEKLADELRTAFPDVSAITHDKAADLPYLNAVLNEVLRIRPVASAGLPRTVPEGGTTICGYFIPGETIISASPTVVHFLEEFWPEPEKFLPERWLVSAEELNEMKRVFIPFSIGPRACIGRALAWMEMRLVLATVIHQFCLHPIPGPDMTPTVRFVLRPADGKVLARVSLRD